MKIRILLNSDGTGVSDTFIRKNILELEAAGHEISVVSGKTRGDAHAIYTGFSSSMWRLKLVRLGAFLRYIPKFRDRFNAFEMQIRQNHAFRRLKRSHLPPADFIVVEYGVCAVVAKRFLLSQNTPFSINYHGIDATKWLHYPFYAKAIVELQPQFHFVPSHHLRRRLELVGVDHQDIHVSPHDAQAAQEVESQERSVPFDFIAIGRMVQKKCPQALVLAMARVVKIHPEASLALVGDGEEAPIVQRLIQLNGLQKNIHMLGALNHQETLKLLCNARIFVQHSVTSGDGDQEGFPVAISEAMLHRKPTISTIHSGISEAVIDGTTGYLVQEHDFETFAERMTLLLDSPQLQDEMGQAGYERIQKIAPHGNRSKNLLQLISNQL